MIASFPKAAKESLAELNIVAVGETRRFEHRQVGVQVGVFVDGQDLQSPSLRPGHHLYFIQQGVVFIVCGDCEEVVVSQTRGPQYSISAVHYFLQVSSLLLFVDRV